MGVRLLTIDDPRDNLERAKRTELANFARAQGVKEIVPTMPAILMRNILRSRGLTNIQIPKRTLGKPMEAAQPEPSTPVPQMDASHDLMRQWMQQNEAAAPPATPEPVTEIAAPPPPASHVKYPDPSTMRRAALMKLGAQIGVPIRNTDSRELLAKRVRIRLEEMNGEDATQ